MSLHAGSGKGSHTPRPSSCGRQTRTSLQHAARGETAGQASATAGSRSHGEGLFCEIPAIGHPETCINSSGNNETTRSIKVTN